MGTILQ